MVTPQRDGPPVHDFERDRLDYDTTVRRFEKLTDIRFKLLGFLPTVTGAGIVAVMPMEASGRSGLVVGLLGLMATLGLLIYEMRNTQLYDALWYRAICLEARMRFEAADGESEYGGSFLGQPSDRRALGGRLSIKIGHTLALALVYGAALGAWAWIAGSAALVASGIGSQAWAWAPAAVIGLAGGWGLFQARNTTDYRTPGYADQLPDRFRLPPAP